MRPIIWGDRPSYIVYVDKYELKQRISALKGVKLHSDYFYPDGRQAWAFNLPSKYRSQVAKMMGLSLRAEDGDLLYEVWG